MNRRRIAGFILISLLTANVSPAVAACGSGKVPNYTDIDAIWYQRTNCFGKCPGYEVAFYSDGDCYYVGYRYVSKLGRYGQTCTSRTFKRAKQILQSHDFYHLNYDSSVLVMDAPHYIVATQRCGVATKLDWPAFENRRDIESLLDGLDTITDNIHWHKISNSTELMEYWLNFP